MRIAGEIVNLGRSTRSATWRPRHKIGGLLLFFICGAPIYERIQAGTDCLKGCSKTGTSEVFALPIGSHGAHRQAQFEFSTLVRTVRCHFRAPVARAPWPPGPSPLDRRGTPHAGSRP